MTQTRKDVNGKENKHRKDGTTPMGPKLVHGKLCHLMSGYTKFAVIGAGAISNYIVQELLKDKAAEIVKKVAILTRRVKYPSSD
jgi:hypothetical protein